MWWMLGAVCNAVIGDDRSRHRNRPLRTTAALVEHLDREPEPAPLPPEDPEQLKSPAPS
jgi:hypothetical protein